MYKLIIYIATLIIPKEIFLKDSKIPLYKEIYSEWLYDVQEFNGTYNKLCFSLLRIIDAYHMRKTLEI